MALKKKKPKGKKIAKIILIIILLVYLIIFLGINSYIEGIIKSKVDTQLNNNPKSLYQISYEDLDLNILSGSISIKNILIQPSDSATWMLNNGIVGSVLSSHIELFKIKRLKIFDFISDNDIYISKVILENATTKQITNPKAEKSKKTEKSKNRNRFPEVLNKISIDDFQFKNATFKIANYEQVDDYLFEIDSLSISISDVYIDDKTIQNTIPLSFSKIEIIAHLLSVKSMKFYSISTSGIDLNVQDTSITLKSLSLTPKYSRDEYNKIIKYNDDLFSINTEKIVLKGLDLNKIKQSELINFNSVDIYSPVISIYRDKRLPDAPFKKKKLITSLLLSIPKSIDIDTLRVKNARLSYEEMHNTIDTPGKVFFEPLNLTAYNLTNDSGLIKNNPHLHVDVEAMLMAKSKLKANFDFYLNRRDDYFTAQGNLEAISGTEFNQMLASLMLAKIESCNVHRAAFTFVANDNKSTGNLELIYDNLEASLLKQKDPNKKSKTLSWFAGNFVAKSNLPNDPKYRTGIINFERNKDKAIVNFLWNSVKTGLITSLVPMAEKRELKKKAKKHKEDSKEKKRKSRNSNRKK